MAARPPVDAPHEAASTSLRCLVLPATYSVGRARLNAGKAKRAWQRHTVAASRRGSDNDGGEGEDKPAVSPKELMRKVQVDAFVQLITSTGGVKGTLAVILAAAAGVDAFGNLHWDNNDVLLGLALALPVMVFDTALMLPDYTPKSLEKKIKLPRRRPAPPAPAAAATPPAPSWQSDGTALSEYLQQLQEQEAVSTAAMPTSSPTAAIAGSAPSEASDGAGEEPEYVERTIRVRQPQQPWLAALHRLQQSNVMSNPGLQVPPAWEAAVIVVANLADDMLYRAVLLTGASLWLTDRFYEANMDDTVLLPGGALLTPFQLAQWACIGMPALLLAGAAVWRAMASASSAASSAVRVLDSEGRNVEASSRGMFVFDLEGREVKDTKSAPAKAKKGISKVMAEVTLRNNLALAVDILHTMVPWVLFSGGYVATGNLLTSLVGAVASDALFSVYQRVKLKSAVAAQAAQLEEMIEVFRTIKGGPGTAEVAKDAGEKEPEAVAAGSSGSIKEDSETGKSDN